MSRFASLLVENQVATVADIERALQRQVIRGGDLSTNLLELGTASEEILTRYLAKDLGMDPVPPHSLDHISRQVLISIPHDLIQKHRILPYAMDEAQLKIAVDHEPDSDTLAQIDFFLGLEIISTAALPFRIAMALAQNLGVQLAARFVSLAKKITPDFDPEAPPRLLTDTTSSGIIDGVDPRREPGGQTESPVVVSGPIISLSGPAAGTVSTVPPPEPAKQRFSSISAVQKTAFSNAVDNISDAADRDGILTAVLELASSFFSWSALFVIQDSEAQGWRAVDPETGIASIENISFPLSESGLFGQAAAGSLAFGVPRRNSDDIKALKAMNCRPRAFFVAPVLMRAKPVMLLYGDCGRDNIPSWAASDISTLLAKAGDALEKLILKKKLGAYRSPEKPEQKKGPAGKFIRTSALAAALNTARSRDQAPQAPTADPVSGESDTISDGIDTAGERITLEDWKVASPGNTKGTGGDSDTTAQAPSRPGKIRTLPGFDTSQALVEVDEGWQLESGRTVEKEAAVEAPAPVEEVTEQKPAAGEASGEPWLDQLMSPGGADDEFIDSIVSMGDEVLDDLVRVFPGPLNRDRFRDRSGMDPLENAGPVVEVMLRFGERALETLLKLMDSFDPDVRFHALAAAGRIRDNRILSRIVPRLFDCDQQIRKKALDLLRDYNDVPLYELVLGEIREKLLNDDEPADSKRTAVVVLGELLDREAVPLMAAMLGGSDAVLAERCHRALVKITSHDFGFSEKRWMSWWKVHQDQHRVEWLIEALLGRHAGPRASAGLELSELASIPFDLPDNPTAEDREEIYRIWRAWWENEGSAIFDQPSG